MAEVHEQGVGKGSRASTFSPAPPPPSTSAYSPTWTLSEPRPLGFLGILHRHFTSGHWWLIQCPALLPWYSPFGYMICSPSNQPLSLGDSKSQHININSGMVERGLLWILWYHYISSFWKFQGYKKVPSSVQEMVSKTKYIFLIVSHHITVRTLIRHLEWSDMKDEWKC